MTQHIVPRSIFQDGFLVIIFSLLIRIESIKGIRTTTKIFIDGVDQSSNFSFPENHTNELTEPHTTERSHSKRPQPIKLFDFVDLLFSPCDKTKAPDSDDSVKVLTVEYTKQGNVVSFLDQGTQTISFI